MRCSFRNLRGRRSYERAQGLKFMTFKAIIIFLWLLAIRYEIGQVIRILNWVVAFPDGKPLGDGMVEMIQDPSAPTPTTTPSSSRAPR